MFKRLENILGGEIRNRSRNERREKLYLKFRNVTDKISSSFKYWNGGYSVTYSGTQQALTRPASQPGSGDGGAALNVWYGWTGQPTNPALSAVCATLQPTAAACL